MTAQRTLVIEPLGGVAGDMLLGALLDLGASEATLREALASLDLPNWELRLEATRRRALGCTRAHFEIPPEHAHRHLPEILDRIEASALAPEAKTLAARAFTLLAEAEGRVHRIAPEKVHFHEVGATDAILDICGVSSAAVELGLHRKDTVVRCEPLPLGSGTVYCDHGEMPVPVPAVTELLQGWDFIEGGQGEMVTPTGAALIRALCEEGSERAPRAGFQKLRRVGLGAGTRESSVLRLRLMESSAENAPEDWQREECLVLETHLDDARGTELAFLSERLFEAGAYDVAFAPLTMKKSRPAHAMTVIAPVEVRTALLVQIFDHSPSLGVRERVETRTILSRREGAAQLRGQALRTKIAGGRARPEFEDLAKIARERGCSLRELEMELAQQVAQAQNGEEAE